MTAIVKTKDFPTKGILDHLLYRADGLKNSINKKQIVICAFSVFAVASIAILVQDDSSAPAAARSPIEYNEKPNSEENDSRAIPKYNTGVKSNKKAVTKKVAIIGAEVLSRPKLNQIPPGLMAKAVLVSGASNGLTKTQLTEALVFNGDTLIEDGSILVGRGSSTEERLFIRFDRLVHPDGSVEQINAQACDSEDKIVGLKGSLLGNHAVKLAGSIGLGFVGGLTEALQDSRGEGGVEIRPPTMRNALLHGTATAALDQSRELISQMKDKTPIIEVPEGTKILILIDGTQ